MSIKQINAKITTPLWVAGFSLFTLSLVFYAPSWLPEPDPSLLLRDFSFIPDNNSTTSPKNIQKPVKLPHDWHQDNSDFEGGSYQFPVYFTATPEQPLFLFITHVQQTADISIDGIPITSNISESPVKGRMWSRPLLFTVPVSSITPGPHNIRIYLHSEPVEKGLLGKVYLGPADELQSVWKWRYYYRFSIVTVITFGLFFLGLFMGILWLLRREEALYGGFSLCAFSWCLHNIPHIVEIPESIPPKLWDSLYYATLGWMVIFLVIFNHRFAGNSHPKIEKILLLYLLFGTGIFFFLPQEWFQFYAYWIWNTSLLFIGAYAIFYLLYINIQAPVKNITLLIMVGIIIMCFGLNDYMIMTGLIDRTRGLLIQFSSLPAMLVFIWFILSRFVDVLADSEALNLVLEQRVREKEIELTVNYERLKKLEQEQLLAEERSRIMQDVHDGVGGQLVATLAEIESGNASTIHIKDALSRSLTDLRLVIDSLDTASEDLPTLLGMLRTRMQPSLDSHNIHLHWHVTSLPALEDYGPQKALQLMRILQEAIVNVIKHSRADNLYVTTDIHEEMDGLTSISVEIRDDGGWVEPAGESGRGLKNMSRRAKGIDAQINVYGDEQGTAIQVILSGRKKQNPEMGPD